MNGVHTLSAIATKPTAVIIADQLREGIIDGVFEPGDQINEAQVASQLNVSRGPVREALHRLMQEGILIGRPNRGVFVRKLTAADVGEVYQAREAIELAAASILAGKDASSRVAVTEQLNQVISHMREAVEARDWSAVHRIDLEFHTTLVREARNTRLMRAYATLATEALICMAHFADAHPDPDHVLLKHQEIVALLMAGDLPALHDTLRQHLSVTEDELRSSDDVEQPLASPDEAMAAPALRSV
ncbi:GntR family transcriptional regulator [Sinomonas sp. JGH33]|uniref:GntR family transcriptional regulator n=1 Tax=Sinomonas terricola TaxID=3110330 RepID=A0ABU5T627_9MICC|nr:GntR family transcriptional regulator [Sinomonas sp. JGH33]MEA5455109.1 GntR family transcriptional regulator [Sinomonas sp. JGH33]